MKTNKTRVHISCIYHSLPTVYISFTSTPVQRDYVCTHTI